MLTSPSARPVTGYTLIEMMVALALGLIISAAVTGLVVANINNNNAMIKGMRASEEARALNEIITRELRRARYDAAALGNLGSGASGTTFKTIDTATSECIKYAYDANGNGAGDSGEFRMFSRQVVGGKGVVKFGQFADAASVSCTGGVAISSDDVDVECLRFVKALTNTTLASSSGDACYSTAPSPAFNTTLPANSVYFALRVKQDVDGANTALSTTRRRLESVVMIRSPQD